MVKKKAATTTPRKPRADAERNRARILEVAKQVFTAKGADASLDEIAKLAEVGPGTLYRHFPTRSDLLTEVYRTEVQRLSGLQKELSAKLPPLEALRDWMLLFIEYMATKQIIWPAISQTEASRSAMVRSTGGILESAITTLTDTAIRNGDIRPGIPGMDLLRAIYGLSVGEAGAGSDWTSRARTMVDILLAGSRP